MKDGAVGILVEIVDSYSVGQDVSCFHLGQEVSGGELELILQVNLQQSIIVANIILCPWREKKCPKKSRIKIEASKR